MAGTRICSACPGMGILVIEKNLDVDFSLQAVAYEALLEAIAQTAGNNTMAIDGLDANGYWFTDVILPFDFTAAICTNHPQ